jgi:hypothetical protein
MISKEVFSGGSLFTQIARRAEPGTFADELLSGAAWIPPRTRRRRVEETPGDISSTQEDFS